MKRYLVILLLITVGMTSAIAGRQDLPEDLLPIEALEKLEESAGSDCAICARQLQKEAFTMLSLALDPGRVIQTARTCPLSGGPSSTKTANLIQFSCQTAPTANSKAVSNAFLQVVFRFHTEQDHLVGIDKKDYTPERFASLYRNASAGTLFSGTLEIVSFSYGDGPSFLYLASERQLRIHCRIVDLHPYSP